jgi:hypothetical protein
MASIQSYTNHSYSLYSVVAIYHFFLGVLNIKQGWIILEEEMVQSQGKETKFEILTLTFQHPKT